MVVYIAVLRLSELPAKEFKRMIASQDGGKMHALLSFLFTDEGSHSALEAAWCVEFEDGFVRDQLLGARMMGPTPQCLSLSCAPSAPFLFFWESAAL